VLLRLVLYALSALVVMVLQWRALLGLQALYTTVLLACCSGSYACQLQGLLRRTVLALAALLL